MSFCSFSTKKIVKFVILALKNLKCKTAPL